MKSNSRHTLERDLTTANNSMRRAARYMPSLLIADRSMPQVGLRRRHGSCILAGPAVWRWRKHAPFPRSGTEKDIEDHWAFVKKLCLRKPEAQWPSR